MIEAVQAEDVHGLAIGATALFANRDLATRQVGQHLQLMLLVRAAIKEPDWFITNTAQCFQIPGPLWIDQPALHESHLDGAVGVEEQVGILLSTSGGNQPQFNTALGKKCLVLFAVFTIRATVGACGNNHGFWRRRVGEQNNHHHSNKGRDRAQQDLPGEFGCLEAKFGHQVQVCGRVGCRGEILIQVRYLVYALICRFVLYSRRE